MAEQVDWFVGMPNKLEKPLTYVVTQEGIYQIRLTPYAVYTAKMEINKIPHAEYRAPQVGIQFLDRKIPLRLLSLALAFFREVYQQRGTEALMMIFYDPQTKEFEPYVPRQYASPAMVEEINATERPEGKIMVAHIHSHPNFYGRFSGIDDHDDHRCGDAAIFGVLGNIQKDFPDMSWRISVGGVYVPVEFTDIFTSPLEPQDTTTVAVPAEWLDKLEKRPEPKVQEYILGRYPLLGYYQQDDDNPYV